MKDEWRRRNAEEWNLTGRVGDCAILKRWNSNKFSRYSLLRPFNFRIEKLVLWVRIEINDVALLNKIYKSGARPIS